MLMVPSLKERLIKGGIWAVAGRVVGVATGLAVNVLLVRLLTPEEMGSYFLTISAVSVAALIAQFGLPTAVVRLVAEAVSQGEKGRAKSIIKLSVILCGLSSLLIAGVFYLGLGRWLAESFFESIPMEGIIDVATVLIIVTALQGLIAEIFRSFHDMRFATLFGGVTTSSLSAIAFGVIWMLQGHSDLRQVMFLSLGAYVAAFFIAVFFLRGKFHDFDGYGVIDTRSLLMVSAPMGIISLAVFAATQGDLWVVGAFLPEQQVAIYGAVLRLLVMMTMSHSLVVAVVQSTIAEMYGQNDMKQMERLVQIAAFAACIPALALLGVYAIFGNGLLGVLFGVFYQDGYWPLLVVSAGQFLGMLFGPAGMVLMMTGYQKQLMKLILVTACMSFVLAVWLVTIYGLAGVAIAWSVGSILQGAGSWMLARKKLNINCHASLVSINELKEIILCKS